MAITNLPEARGYENFFKCKIKMKLNNYGLVDDNYDVIQMLKAEK